MFENGMFKTVCLLLMTGNGSNLRGSVTDLCDRIRYRQKGRATHLYLMSGYETGLVDEIHAAFIFG